MPKRLLFYPLVVLLCGVAVAAALGKWEKVYIPSVAWLSEVAFPSADEGWAVGYDASYRGVVYHYLDTHNVEPTSLGAIKALYR